jgi:hypothetical protein
MAELAIPLVALGGLYLISNKNGENNESRENFVNMGGNQNLVTKPADINYPVNKLPKSNIRQYDSPNQATDKYFKETTYENTHNKNPEFSVGGSKKDVVGLTGNIIDTNNFKHNNMVPFFGSKIKGNTSNFNNSETMLDNLQGHGSQYYKKKEQAPLFKPQRNLNFSNGTPNTTDFYRSRQNPSMKMSNIKPWNEEKVAPGLGLGYNTNSSGSGYNAAVESRDCWLPKTVNELRVETNPKITYDLYGHEGPIEYYIKEGSTVKTQGKVEKNRPDTDYTLGPSRWFTTTGLEKAQTARGIEVLQHTNRPDTTVEYYGVGVNDNKATYVSGEYRDPHKQQLKGNDYMAPSASGKHNPTTNDHGNNTYTNYSNNRATTKQPENFGYIQGMIKAAVAPIFDVLRPSRKENVINNIRPNGNAGTNVSNLPIYNPADRTKTTIREQTENKLDNNHLNVQNQSQDAYLVSEQQSVSQNRDTTSIHYGGNAGPHTVQASQTYDYVYNQRNNVNKTYKNRPNHGTANMHNNSQFINVAKLDNDRINSRLPTPHSAVPLAPKSHENIAITNHRNQYNSNINCDRINPDILKAFKENPYTKSLNSW